MSKRLWETEKFTLNLATGELVRSVTSMFIEGENFEHAHKRLLESGMVWLRLTGNWYSKESIIPKQQFQEQKDEVQEGIEDAFKLDKQKKSKKEPTTFNGFDILDFEAFQLDPVGFLESFDLDQLFDWLDTLDHEQVKQVWRVSVENRLTKKTQVIEGYISYKYGDTR